MEVRGGWEVGEGRGWGMRGEERVGSEERGEGME